MRQSLIDLVGYTQVDGYAASIFLCRGQRRHSWLMDRDEHLTVPLNLVSTARL